MDFNFGAPFGGLGGAFSPSATGSGGGDGPARGAAGVLTRSGPDARMEVNVGEDTVTAAIARRWRMLRTPS